MAAEVLNQLHQLALNRGLARRRLAEAALRFLGSARHRALLAPKHLDLRAAETVDGLLGIAHSAERAAALAGEVAHQIDLLLVGVLELVDHHQLEAPLVGTANGGVVAEGSEGQAKQVVVVEHRALGLELVEAVEDGPRQLEQLLHGTTSQPGVCVDEGVRHLGLEPGDTLLGKSLARTRRVACHEAAQQVGAGARPRFEPINGRERALGELNPLAAAVLGKLLVGIAQTRKVRSARQRAQVVEPVATRARKLG